MPYEFENRWVIEGVLATESPLHIGNGDTVTSEELWLLDDADKPVLINAIARDAADQPYVPASALKGSLRGWLEARLGSQHAKLQDWLGYQDHGKSGNGRAGRFEFLDAHLVKGTIAEVKVGARTAIDRATRTVADRKLFYAEQVAEQAQFAVRFAAQNVNEDGIALMLEALEQGCRERTLTLGAGGADGWGQVAWRATGVSKLTRAGALAHLQKGHLGFANLPPVALTSLDPVRATWRPQLAGGQGRLRLGIALRFDGAFVVNDPSRTKNKHSPANSDLPNHAPKLDRRQQAYLPASSFRGAFRSQAERIFRTIGFTGTMKPSDIAATNMAEVKAKLDPVSWLFGASGWRAPLEVSDFRLAANEERTELRQEFVAIDRFTGGGAEHLKFNAMYALRPVFHGTLEVDLGALERAGAKGWALALLAFTLRDLREGDITFGFGAAKGYGACRAEFTSVECRGGFDGAAEDDVKRLFRDGVVAAGMESWFGVQMQQEVTSRG